MTSFPQSAEAAADASPDNRAANFATQFRQVVRGGLFLAYYASAVVLTGYGVKSLTGVFAQ